MSQKAWMAAYTKGSKSIQARLAKIHANNPEFQEFVKKHGFGGNLSAKQAEKQKKTSIGVQQTEKNAPTKGPVDREAMIRAAAEKLRDRKLASANRAAFGGELGGGFSIPNMSFRTYRESLDYKGLKRLSKKPTKAEREYMKNDPENQAQFERIRKKFAKRANLAYLGGKKVNEELKVGDQVKLRKDWAGEDAGKVFTIHHQNADGKFWIGHGKSKAGWYVHPHQITKHKSVKEDVDYKDAKLRMRRGGWVVIRNGKQQGIIHPTEGHAKMFADATRETLGHKVMKALRLKAKSFARAHYATESAANRRRVRSWDSAIMPELKPLRVKPKQKLPFDPDPPKANPGVVVGKNNPGYSRARHLARLGLKKAMEKSNV